MLNRIEAGADVVVGSRYIRGGSVGNWGLWRRTVSWAATELARQTIGIALTDPLSGFFMMRKQDFLSVQPRLNNTGFKICLEIIAKLPNQHVSEIAYVFRKRRAGRSKLSTRVALQYVRQLCSLSMSVNSQASQSNRL